MYGHPDAVRQSVRIGQSSLTLPLPRFLRHPLVPGSARLKNPRWRSISERNGFSAMKPPVTACKQAMRAQNNKTRFFYVLFNK